MEPPIEWTTGNSDICFWFICFLQWVLILAHVVVWWCDDMEWENTKPGDE